MKSNYKKPRDLGKDNSRKSVKKGSIPTLAQMTNETLKEIPGSVSLFFGFKNIFWKLNSFTWWLFCYLIYEYLIYDSLS